MTCFAGDEDVPRDLESAELWEQLGISPERIAFLGRDDNWWGPAGKTGPCGPDTEMFYWVAADPPPHHFDPADRRWVEIWNDVLMGYMKTGDGAIDRLGRVNVDTGMGVERTLMALNRVQSVYEVDTVKPLMDGLRALLGVDAQDGSRSASCAWSPIICGQPPSS
jgi:alanyl-tRNA synthetase